MKGLKGSYMSLNQKYTWNDFLKEHPDLKQKKIKRTSSEGKKAFNTAFKAKIKEHLSKRAETIEKLTKKATEKRNAIAAKVKEFRKAKDTLNADTYQVKAGRQDSWISRLDKQNSRIKTLQKNF